MDVLGLLSNISQVVDLLIKIGVMCSIYCVDVKNAPRDVRRLLKEVDRLTVVIKELELLLKSTKGSSKLESPGLRQAVFDLRRLLAELVAKLDLGAKHARAVWPFTKRDVHDLVAEIERQKANITLNINIEQTSILLNVHQELVLSKLRVAEAATFDSSVDGEESYCLQGTRSSIIEQIQHWSINPNSQSVFWLNGMAGTGKSTISRTIAQSFANEGVLGASFFFKSGEGDRGRTAFFFTTIAAQLVRRIPSLAPHIREILDIDASIHEKSLNDQFQTLILDPLKKNSECWPSAALLVVIDALDECGSEENMRLLINVFSKAQLTDKPRLKFFVTSRPELPIRLGFGEIGGKYDNLLLAAVPIPTIEHDLDLFMRHQLHIIKTDYNMSVTEHRKISPDWPGEDVVRKLVAAAVPLFIMAATICRFLKDRRLGGPQHQLSKILEYQKVQTSGLDMTYLPILDRLVVGLSSSTRQEVLNKFQYLIGSIVTLAQPLSIGSLSHVLGISTDVVEDQLDLLHSVLSVPSDLDTPGHYDQRLTQKSSMLIYLLQSALSLMDRSAESVYMIDDLLNKIEGANAQMIGNLLQDARRFVLANVAALDKAPLQIYSSALIFTPKESTVRTLFKASIPSWISSLPTMQHHWDPCLATVENHYPWRSHILTYPTGDKFLSLMGYTMKIWNIKTTSCLEIHQNVLSESVKFSPDGRELFYLSASGISGHNVLRIIEAATKGCIAEFSGHTDTITYAAFSEDTQRLASASRDGTVKIWDEPTRKCLATYDYGSSHQIIGFSPNGLTFLMISKFKGIQLLDSTKTASKLTVSVHDNVRAAAFSPDSRTLVYVNSDGIITFLDLLSGTTLEGEGANSAAGTGAEGLVFFSDSNRLISPMKRQVYSGHHVGIWNTSNATCDFLLKGHRASISYIILSKDEKRITSASYDKTIRVWDAQVGTCIAIYDGHDEPINSIAYSADERLLISANTNSDFKVWDTSLESQGKADGHESAVLEVVFSPDKKRIITTSGDRTVKLWDVAIGKCIATGINHRLFAWIPMMVPQDIPSAPFDHIMNTHGLFGWPRSVKFCSNSSKFLSASESPRNDELKLWDSRTGEYEFLLQRGEHAIMSVAFSPDGTTIASTSRDGKLMCWDAVTRKLHTSFGDQTYGISSSAYSPDGTQLVLACDDGANICIGHRRLGISDRSRFPPRASPVDRD
ncbi:hypothetical protein TARUN_3753 [Trichoderma arundinaceum]|uniref:NACHT domain-containing protein n=1 Tax=Trichoderma arundinaceum TaxID=490622 RepID=A0A395NR11_TRIAR|nr:hypothetical protein TARUN_3753 [Trichoderma arundinaceum]